MILYHIPSITHIIVFECSWFPDAHTLARDTAGHTPTLAQLTISKMEEVANLGSWKKAIEGFCLWLKVAILIQFKTRPKCIGIPNHWVAIPVPKWEHDINVVWFPNFEWNFIDSEVPHINATSCQAIRETNRRAIAITGTECHFWREAWLTGDCNCLKDQEKNHIQRRKNMPKHCSEPQLKTLSCKLLQCMC